MPHVLEIKGRSRPGFEVDFRGVISGVYVVSINGKRYGYKPVGMSISDLAMKTGKMAKFSAGKALAWLKKNSTLTAAPDEKAYIHKLMASGPTVLSIVEAPQTVIAARKAQSDLTSASGWLKLAKKSAEDERIAAELDDMDFDVTNVRKGLDKVQKNVGRSKVSRNVRAQQTLRFQ